MFGIHRCFPSALVIYHYSKQIFFLVNVMSSFSQEFRRFNKPKNIYNSASANNGGVSSVVLVLFRFSFNDQLLRQFRDSISN